MKKKIIVKGPALSRSGYGEQTRFALRSLREYQDQFDISLLNLNWGQTGWIWEDNEERGWIDSLIQKTVREQQAKTTEYDMSLQVTIPNEFEDMAKVNVGYTAGVETDLVSPQWIQACNGMDRLIVISKFTKKTLAETSYEAKDKNTGAVHPDYRIEKPITSVSYPVRHFEQEELAGLDLKTDFNFLVVAQWGARKNLEKTILWFLEEFKNDEVGLILKTSTANGSYMDYEMTNKRLDFLLKQVPDLENHKCKLYLVHGDVSEENLTWLYNHPEINCLVSLAHGEGFGLPIFEAAYNGMPVIAPNWSGHLDFMMAPKRDKKTKKTRMRPHFAKVDYDLEPVQPEAVWPPVIIQEAKWCYPKRFSYKKRLREVFKNYSFYKSQAKKLKSYIDETYTAESQYKKFVEAFLGEEVEEKVHVTVEDLPKVSIITSVYDGDEFIESFLEDITRQTIFEQKCELILLNANSPGNEEEIINKYVEQYPDNIVYKRLDKDPGIYAVWNIGVEMSTGEYLTNANLDDRKAPNSIQKHAEELYKNEHIDLVYADMLVTDKPNDVWETNSSQGRKYNFPEYSFTNLKMVNMPHASPMWRKDIHDKYGTFDDKYRSAGDWEMWLRAGSQGAEFLKINDVLGLYYFNPTGISTNPDNFDWKREEETEVYEKYKDIDL
tara:strand:+ start:25 stop:2016 length:1992 start_codon:yes stop_codon:yes gene_type:complete